MEQIKIVEKKLARKYFIPKRAGYKDWELRKEDDIIYNPGMLIKYLEIDEEGNYTGRFIICSITMLFRNIPGLENGFCLYSDKTISKGEIPNESLRNY